MRGLKSQENDKFRRFHAFVQEEAKKRNCVWFGFAGEGNDFKTDDMEGENLTGWLIPEEKADEFEAFWLNNDGLTRFTAWNDFFVWVIWSFKDGMLHVDFEE